MDVVTSVLTYIEVFICICIIDELSFKYLKYSMFYTRTFENLICNHDYIFSSMLYVLCSSLIAFLEFGKSNLYLVGYFIYFSRNYINGNEFRCNFCQWDKGEKTQVTNSKFISHGSNKHCCLQLWWEGGQNLHLCVLLHCS